MLDVRSCTSIDAQTSVAAGTVASVATLKAARATLAHSLNSMLKSCQSRAVILPLLPICQRKSPQTHKLYRLCIRPIRPQDRFPAGLHIRCTMYCKKMWTAPAQSFDRAQIEETVKQRHFFMFLTLAASSSSGCASLVLTRLPP